MSTHSLNDERQGEGGFFSREAVSGVPWMLLSKLVLFFVYFGVSVLTVNGLGKEKFGVFSLMTNISSYLVIVCGLGLGATLTRFIPELAIRKNRKGLIHLLCKSFAMQVVTIVMASVVLLHFSDALQRLFRAEHIEHFKFYLRVACGLTGLLLLKDFVATVFTSFFKMQIVAVLSILQGLAWLGALLVLLRLSPEVGMVFYVQMISIVFVYMVGVVYLVRYVHSLSWYTDEFGIGKRRVFKFAGSAMLSAVIRLMMFKYSEIFFLAAVGGTTLAGIYDLGYTLPFTVVTFIPLSLISLFTAAFAQAYVQDKTCLGRLISSYYKVLIMVSLPVAVLGAFFSPLAYHIIYDGQMDESGQLAAAFCLVLTLPLISMPLSMALKAKEKVHNMLPMMVLQIVVNLFLDWLFIVHLRLGAWGGIGAILGTFAITIAPRLMVAKGIIGGIYFPMQFLLRMAVVLVLDAAVLYGLAAKFKWFERFELNWINLALLFAIAIAYLIVFLVLIRLFKLVRKADIADFQSLEIAPLNWVLNHLFGV